MISREMHRYWAYINFSDDSVVQIALSDLCNITDDFLPFKKHGICIHNYKEVVDQYYYRII